MDPGTPSRETRALREIERLLNPYVRTLPAEIFGGVWISGREGHRRLTLGVTDGPQHHAGAVDPRVRVVATALSYADLTAIDVGVARFLNDLPFWTSTQLDFANGRVVISVVPDDAAALEVAIEERFKDRACLHVIVVDRTPRPVAIRCFRVDASGQQIRLVVDDGFGSLVAEVVEHPHHVEVSVVGVRLRDDEPMELSGHDVWIAVSLAAPLGSRSVVDRTTGQLVVGV